MTVGEIIKSILKSKKLTQLWLCSVMKDKQQNVSKILNDDGMGVEKRVKMLDYLGYEVVVREKRPGRRADGEYVVTADDKKPREILTEAMASAGVDESEIPTIAANTDLIVEDAPVSIYKDEEKPAPKKGIKFNEGYVVSEEDIKELRRRLGMIGDE